HHDVEQRGNVMRARRAAALIGAVGGLALATAGTASAGELGQAPGVCTIGPGPSCLVKGGGGDTSVSPELVRVGQVITFTLTPDGTGIAALPKGWTIGSRTVGHATAP